MAKHKYRLGQMIQSQQASGIIEEIRLSNTGVHYLLQDESTVQEDDVTAVFRPVAPRKPKAANVRRNSKLRAAS